MAQEGSQLPVEWPEKYQTEYNKGNTVFSYVFKLARKTLISWVLRFNNKDTIMTSVKVSTLSTLI